MGMKKLCNVKGCNERHHAKGYCQRHYNKYAVYGDPLAGRTNEQTRFRQGRDQKPKTATTAAIEPKKRGRPRKKAQPVIRQESHYHYEPEPLKDMSIDGTYLFILNQSIIIRLYGEIYKAVHEPLYMAANSSFADGLLFLAMQYAGYRDVDPPVGRLLMRELRGYIEKKDKVKFLYTLANLEERQADYRKPIHTEEQMKLQLV